jgi:hypothetical protein
VFDSSIVLWLKARQIVVLSTELVAVSIPGTRLSKNENLDPIGVVFGRQANAFEILHEARVIPNPSGRGHHLRAGVA